MKIFLSLVLSIACAPAFADPAAQFMRDFTWKNRVLLLFAPDALHAEFRRQRQILAAVPPGLADRDLAIVTVRADSGVRVDGEPGKIDAGALQRRYAVGPGEFRVVLVGKDGGVKLARPQAVPATALFELIDAMPMRRDEMRRRDGG